MEVTNRTSGKGVLSGVQKGSQRSFDVRSWQGLTEVLKMARAANLPDDEYAAFRNTVLEYAQSGGDQSLKEKIENVIATFGETRPMAEEHVPRQIKVEENIEVKKGAPQEEAVAIKIPVLRSARPVPVFKRNGNVPAPQQTEHVIRQKTTLSKDSVPVNLPVGKVSEPVRPSEENPAGPEAVSSLVALEVERQMAAHMPSPTIHKTIEEHKARIAEIKREVNARVGNPIAMIDEGNGIGRAYMSALLGAMRASGGGQAGSLDNAMAELEKAFTAISEYASSHPGKKEKPPLEGLPQPAPSAPPAPPPVPKNIPEEFKPMNKEEVIQPVIEKGNERMMAVKTERTVSDTPVLKEIKEHRTERRQEAEIPKTKDFDSVRELNVAFEKPEIPEAAATTPKPLGKAAFAIPSLADRLKKKAAPKPRTALVEMPTFGPTMAPERGEMKRPIFEKDTERVELPKKLANPVARSENDPTLPSVTNEVQRVAERQEDLHSKEVTAALEQLLNEWSLFKRSGLLGFGPSGKDHPLYKELSELTMFSVIAGRFEKATPDVRLTIKDYVNAWRHEQGITYTPTETFEHYLRRVISRILKRQNHG